MDIVQSLLGLIVFIGIAFSLSENRKAIPAKSIVIGIVLQILLAAALLKTPGLKQVFLWLNNIMLALEAATMAGTSFVFGYLGGGPLPFTENAPGASFLLAFRALPIILLMSAVSAILFHWGVIQKLVQAFSFILRRTMGLGGAVGVSAAANIFVGMVEAPLLIRPYLSKMNRSELFMVMTCGMATIAGTVLVLYATFLNGIIPDAIGHILTASIISAPAALTVSILMLPSEEAMTEGEIQPPDDYKNTMDAITKGTSSGISLLLNIIAMLIVLVGLVSLANQILGIIPDIAGAPVTLERLLGCIMSPVVWLMGIPWSEAHAAGSLMGTKTILNELIAYLQMAGLEPGVLSDRSRVIMTYALCGFANFGSLGIMIGGMGTMVPERKGEIALLGLKSILSGTLATCMTGAVVGLFY
jgi:CNT family concentrative nucleoside transporter